MKEISYNIVDKCKTIRYKTRSYKIFIKALEKLNIECDIYIRNPKNIDNFDIFLELARIPIQVDLDEYNIKIEGG